MSLEASNPPHAEEPAASRASRSTRFFAVAILALAASPAAAIELSAPIACPTGMVCPIQNFFDHDPGPATLDFRCGALGYDGHDGTDVRLPSLAAMHDGVEVRAAADGEIVGARDGMADDGIAGAGGREAVKDVECGNGVMIRHADGYDTQYCHMRRGSVAVKTGDQVTRGQTIGLVGLSGMTEFPHLHLSVRKDGRKIDPYAPDATAGSCGATTDLWAADAKDAMRIEAPLVMNAGFTDGPLRMEDIENGAIEARRPTRDSAAIVVYGRVVGLAAGDGMRLTLKAPNGARIASGEAPPADRPKAQWMQFTGKKRPQGGWPAGDYRATIDILRDGGTLKSTDIVTTISP